ncbi:MAG: MFS transporter, partial [Oscillospiraceae bacterium]|nr:MFS transporter [Oscillospiraceae bacterium]
MSKVRKNNFGLVMAIYLAGIFMGAIDTGIVTPVRTVIQSALGVDDQTGIWMITIYTLAYAASIPIMGKLADTYGRKHVYLISISLFGIGSLACGLSSYFGSFSVLLTARVIQAIGGGGILPVATAEFGTSFPEEKRGMALGLVGGVYGIANIFGSSAGSAIVDIFGHDNWAYIFFINIPITLFIIIAGSVVLDNNKSVNTSKLDFAGIITLTVMILSLLYGLKNIDFFNIGQTITDIKVYPFLILFVLLVPVFILAEKKAKDPVMNLGYFTDKNILITLIISLISGIVMMGMIFIPQFSENALRIQSGSGGYFVIVLGLFAGIGAPVSGKLIDKFGAKLILGFGFAVSAAGAAFLAFVAASHPNIATVLISLGLIGTGIGFTMGTPLNYMMLDNTDDKESNSALAALSLVRSIGTAVAPAVMVGFIAHAGMLVKDNVMAQMPGVVNMPELPYAQEIQDEVDKMKNDPSMKDMADKMQIPDLTRMSMDMDMTSTDSGFEMSPEITELLQSSDVTTITENSKQMAEYMFGQMTPPVISSIQDGIQKGIDSINDSSEKMQKTLETMQTAASAMSDGQMPAMGDGQ